MRCFWLFRRTKLQVNENKENVPDEKSTWIDSYLSVPIPKKNCSQWPIDCEAGIAGGLTGLSV